MAKTTRRPRYTVTVVPPGSHSLAPGTMVFAVRDGDGHEGELRVTPGGVCWRPPRGQYLRVMTWAQFAVLMAKEWGDV